MGREKKMTTNSCCTSTAAHDESVTHARASTVGEGSGGKTTMLDCAERCRAIPLQGQSSRFVVSGMSSSWSTGDADRSVVARVEVR